MVMWIVAAKSSHPCILDDVGIILWTAGQRMDMRNPKSKFVWKQKHNENQPDLPRAHVFKDRRRRSASSSDIIGTIDRDYLMYDMRYENWIKGHPGDDDDNACVGMSADEKEKYGWLAVSCEVELCFVCENPDVENQWNVSP